MKKRSFFGEKVEGYDIRVFNEREVRAAAGILFLFAIIAFLNAFLVGNFNPIKIFIIIFFIDFAIRLFINPRYAPSMILGRIAVHKQKPEYAGAPQKKFAWGIGFALAAIMFYIIVIRNLKGPLNLTICILCLTFLFFESVFGICIGCKLYNLFNKKKAELCPGGVCEIQKKQKIQEITFAQIITLIIFIVLIIYIATSFILTTEATTSSEQSQLNKEDCVAPDWAIELGHEEIWKLHNGCG